MLLFRALELPSVNLSEEDIEGYTMQTRLNMPVYSSQDPSRQVWSRFHHSEIPNPDTLSYRWTSFKNHLVNLWANYSFNSEMQAILSSNSDLQINEKKKDSDYSMVIG